MLKSTFLNDAYVFQMDIRRWYPLALRRKKSARGGHKNKVSPRVSGGGDCECLAQLLPPFLPLKTCGSQYDPPPF